MSVLDAALKLGQTAHGCRLRQFCSAGIWLHDGHAQWFDDIDGALKAYQESIAA